MQAINVANTVVINMMFNTVKLLSIISERTEKNKHMREVIYLKLFFGEWYENYHYRADFSVELSMFLK
jgi:hypothetical protein